MPPGSLRPGSRERCAVPPTLPGRAVNEGRTPRRSSCSFTGLGPARMRVTTKSSRMHRVNYIDGSPEFSQSAQRVHVEDVVTAIAKRAARAGKRLLEILGNQHEVGAMIHAMVPGQTGSCDARFACLEWEAVVGMRWPLSERICAPTPASPAEDVRAHRPQAGRAKCSQAAPIPHATSSTEVRGTDPWFVACPRERCHLFARNIDYARAPGTRRRIFRRGSGDVRVVFELGHVTTFNSWCNFG